MQRWLAFVLAGLLLISCDLGPPGSWRVTAAGVGPLDSGTRYDVAAIARAFPDFRVEESATIYHGDIPLRTIAVMDGKAKVLEVTADGRGGINWVWVYDERFVTRAGRRVGQSWRQSGIRKGDCRPDLHWFDTAAALRCVSHGDPGLALYVQTAEFSPSKVRRGKQAIAYDLGVIRKIEWNAHTRLRKN